MYIIALISSLRVCKSFVWEYMCWTIFGLREKPFNSNFSLYSTWMQSPKGGIFCSDFSSFFGTFFFFFFFFFSFFSSSSLIMGYGISFSFIFSINASTLSSYCSSSSYGSSSFPVTFMKSAFNSCICCESSIGGDVSPLPSLLWDISSYLESRYPNSSSSAIDFACTRFIIRVRFFNSVVSYSYPLPPWSSCSKVIFMVASAYFFFILRSLFW